MFYLHNGLRVFLTRQCSLTSLTREAIGRARYASQQTITPVKVGDTLPNAELFENFPANKVNLKDLTAGKKVVLFSVCGAYTPNCSKTHLPGYVMNAKKIKAEGVDEIVCVSVNDPYVMAAWGAEHDTKGKIRMLADPSGAFIKAIGLDIDLPQLGGLRAKRFSMVITDNHIEKLNVEPDGTGLSCSLAYKLIKKKEDEKLTKKEEDEKLLKKEDEKLTT